MLQPSLLVRKSLALAGVLLLLVSGGADAFGLHRCAHHDGVPQATQQASAHHDHHGDPDEQQDAEGCSCVGTCSLSSVAVTPIAASAEIPVSPARATARVGSADVVRAIWQAYLLPYSTAPPASL